MTDEQIIESIADAYTAFTRNEVTAVQKQSITYTVQWWRKMGSQNLDQLAYICATAHGEANWISQKEKRDRVGGVVRGLQDKYWNTGFFGRGLVQLTWKRNYQNYSRILGVDLMANPDKVLETETSARILVYGMVYGNFTGKSLDNYISSTKVDFLNARRIINGLFKASDYEAFAKQYQSYLKAA